jgi:hypothetical protein
MNAPSCLGPHPNTASPALVRNAATVNEKRLDAEQPRIENGSAASKPHPLDNPMTEIFVTKPASDITDDYSKQQ